MTVIIIFQIALLIYHQVTTRFDFFPFNGARHYSTKEKQTELMVNGILMSLAPIGFIFNISALKNFGLYYYFILFALELWVWWIPYFFTPKKLTKKIYNVVLSIATSSSMKNDSLNEWQKIYERIHANTIIILPKKSGGITPNLEHMLLHSLTLATALITYKLSI